MNIKPLKQPNSSACGPACIKMAADYFGASITFKEIEVLSDYKKKEGLNDKDIVETLRQINLNAVVQRNVSWEALKKFTQDKNTIIILSWMKDGYKGHVSVLKGITDKYILLIDPDVGKIIKIEKIKFMRLWMEYDDLWWPEKSSDIHLRTIIKITN